jgi:hypothetical protein
MDRSTTVLNDDHKPVIRGATNMTINGGLTSNNHELNKDKDNRFFNVSPLKGHGVKQTEVTRWGDQNQNSSNGNVKPMHPYDNTG